MEAENSLLQESFGPLSTEHGSTVGIILQGELPFDDWKDRCASVGKVKNFGPFALGDVFGYGVARYGEKRAFAQEPIKLADHTIAFVKKCADVCKAVPYHIRNKELSFEHHSHVSKVKASCNAHADGPDANCADCEQARLNEITHWLDEAEKKHWTASDLKDKLAAKRQTTVREHQRSLDGADFDPQTVRDAWGILKHQMMVIKEKYSGIITGKGKLDKGKSKTFLSKLDDLDAASAEMRKLLSGEIGG